MDGAILRELVTLQQKGEAGVMALVVGSDGSAPQVMGARLLLTAAGQLFGTIGGGRIEQEVILRAKELLASGGGPLLLRLNLGSDLGMACGGKMDVFLEPVRPRTRLVIFGAGHVGMAVARMAQLLDFDIWVVDDRPEFATPDRFPDCQLLVQPFAETAERFQVRSGDYLLIVTYGHQHDGLLCGAFARGPQEYLGMIGSRTKVAVLLGSLRDQGIPEAELARIHTPVGLEIGAITPAEIAVSILAEMIRIRRRHPADPLTRNLAKGAPAE